MTCTNCGSARTLPTGNCGTCGAVIVPPTTWQHPDGSGPVDVDATLQFVMPPIEELDRNRVHAMFGAADGYGIGPSGMPDGPMAGRSYAVPFPAEAPAPRIGTAEPQAADFNAVEVRSAQFGAAGYLANAAANAEVSFGAAEGLAAPVNSPYRRPEFYGTPADVPNRFSLVALILSGLALLVLPAGLAAMFFASIARNRSESLGPMSFTVAAGASLVGCLVGAVGLIVLL